MKIHDGDYLYLGQINFKQHSRRYYMIDDPRRLGGNVSACLFSEGGSASLAGFLFKYAIILLSNFMEVIHLSKII